MKTRLITVLFTVLLCGAINVSAQPFGVCPEVKFEQDTLVNSKIYFRHDKTIIDTTYLDNRNTLEIIKSILGPIASEASQSIASIIIEGSSSPVGNNEYNQRLSMRRAEVTEAFLRTIPGLETVDMTLLGKGEDWDTFTKDIKESYKRKNRKQVIQILDSNYSIYKKERKLKALERDHTTWRYLSRNYMASQRNSITIVVIKKSRALDMLPHLDAPTTNAQTSESTLVAPQPQKPAGKVPVASIRTNLLVPALNVGAELPIGNHWSVAADYYYPWIWPSQKNKNCFEFLGWSVEGRYWFGRDRKPQDRLKGHSVGVYVAGGYYDFERNYRGMQGEFVSPGLDYTYSMAIGRQKNMHLQFTLAVGYIRSWGRTYDVYGDYGELYPDEGTVIWDYVGPTKAAVSLVVPIYNKKEGRR